MSNLEMEIIKKFLGNLGIVSSNFGKVGITTKGFLIDKLNFKNDLNELESFDLYCGKIILENNSLIRALVINMKDEFILTFRMDAFPIYGLSLITDVVGNFIICDENNKWQSASTITQLQALIGIEQITQDGIMWKPCADDYEDLKKALITLVDN